MKTISERWRENLTMNNNMRTFHTSFKWEFFPEVWLTVNQFDSPVAKLSERLYLMPYQPSEVKSIIVEE